ncbi:MAG: hydroxymethylglutaryl-CoA lyase [Proteobacteria bacterium]|nr:MAG: hydroxymethylglutaryl-CoA lyase [Pseudomonadota bacterium]
MSLILPMSSRPGRSCCRGSSTRCNRNNVRRSPEESVEEHARLLAAVPAGTMIRLNLATAFDCPFEDRIPVEKTLALLDRLVPLKPDAEICSCDTTGRADPRHVADLFAAVRQRFPTAKAWAFHAHDTYGLGLANVHAAYREGVRIFDASFAGLGGCPFAAGATGMSRPRISFGCSSALGVSTGIDLGKLLLVAQDGAAIPGRLSGGRVRSALSARRDACVATT